MTVGEGETFLFSDLGKFPVSQFTWSRWEWVLFPSPSNVFWLHTSGEERLFRFFIFPVLPTHFSQQSRAYSPFLPRQNRKRLHCLWAGAPLTCQLGAKGSSISCLISPVLALVDSFNFFLAHLLCCLISAVYCWRSLAPSVFFSPEGQMALPPSFLFLCEFLCWRCLLRCSLDFLTSSPLSQLTLFLEILVTS